MTDSQYAPQSEPNIMRVHQNNAEHSSLLLGAVRLPKQRRVVLANRRWWQNVVDTLDRPCHTGHSHSLSRDQLLKEISPEITLKTVKSCERTEVRPLECIVWPHK